jgi:hypothetical protein
MPYIGAFLGFFAGFIATAGALTLLLQIPFHHFAVKMWANEKLGLLAYLPPLGGLVCALLGWRWMS